MLSLVTLIGVVIFVSAFIIVLLLFITLIKCLKGHKSLGMLYGSVLKKLPYITVVLILKKW